MVWSKVSLVTRRVRLLVLSDEVGSERRLANSAGRRETHGRLKPLPARGMVTGEVRDATRLSVLALSGDVGSERRRTNPAGRRGTQRAILVLMSYTSPLLCAASAPIIMGSSIGTGIPAVRFPKSLKTHTTRVGGDAALRLLRPYRIR